jgi:hypothetical protein
MNVSAVAPASYSVESYVGDVVSTASRFDRLASTAAASDSTSDAHEFFASVSPAKWAPRVVVVRSGSSVAGAVYLKERKLLNVPVGLLYADGVLRRCIVANEGDLLGVTLTALKRIFASPRVTGLRFAVRPGGPEYRAILQAAKHMPLDVTSCPVQNHMCLPLAPAYDSFLNGLGSRTRRNMRYYRRRSEAAGNYFVDSLSVAEFHSAAAKLISAGGVGADEEGQQRALRRIEVLDQPMLVGLRDRTGRWLSILAGWYDPTDATVFYQLNDDRRHPQDSLSIVLRGYLIEQLIASGKRNLFFWGGVGGSLSAYSHYIPTASIYLDAQSTTWKAIRRVASVGFLMPAPVGSLMTWVTPDPRSEPKKIL